MHDSVEMLAITRDWDCESPDSFVIRGTDNALHLRQPQTTAQVACMSRQHVWLYRQTVWCYIVTAKNNNLSVFCEMLWKKRQGMSTFVTSQETVTVTRMWHCEKSWPASCSTLASSTLWTINNRFRLSHSVYNSWQHLWCDDSRARWTTAGVWRQVNRRPY